MFEAIALIAAILISYLVIKLISKVFWMLVKLAAASVLGFALFTYHAEILTYAQGLLQ